MRPLFLPRCLRPGSGERPIRPWLIAGAVSFIASLGTSPGLFLFHLENSMIFTLPVDSEKLSRFKFRRDATPIPVSIEGRVVGDAKPKQSKTTGSLGWGLNAKCHMNVGGKIVYCQVNLSVTIIGSKTAPEMNSDDPKI